MQNKFTKFLTAFLLLFFCVHRLNGQSDTNAIVMLKSNDFSTRKEGVQLLKQQRLQNIDILISILNGNFSPDVKDSAAIALGNCRASEAVNVLIKNIDLDVRGRVILGLLSEEEGNPVSTSLVKIGNPSIPAIIQLLEETGSVLDNGKTLDDRRSVEIRALLLRALCRIDGDKDIVRLRLQKAMKAETDSKKQARLQSALDALDKTSF